MKKFTTFIFLGIFSLFGFPPLKAQWAQKTNFAGSSRSGGTAFTLGNKIYFVGGLDNFPNQDVWMYDAAADTWTQKADFTGGYRSAATAFVINNKAYVGLGSNSNLYFNDLWEYDETNDTWTQKTSFPGDGRDEAVGFAINGKGYIGTGQKFFVGPNSSFTIAYNDFYEYDPVTDTWTQKANVPGSPRMYATGCAVGNKGYLGFGSDNQQLLSYTDFYSYDPATDTWTMMNTGASYAVADAGMFAIGTDCYLVGGIDFSNFSATTVYRKYNTLTDTWSNGGTFTGGIIASPAVASVNGKGYAGTGFDQNINPRNDWYELTPVTSTLTTGVSEMKTEVSMLTVGPNPAKSEITVAMHNKKELTYVYNISNLMGEIIMNGILNSELNKIELPVSMCKGVYVLNVMNPAGAKVATRKIIKD